MMRWTIAALRSRPLRRQRDGIAAVEFGLLAPVFVMIFAGTVDISGALIARTRLDGAVAAGTNQAIVNASSVSSTGGATLASAIATMVSTSNNGTPAGTTVVVNNGPAVTITNGTPASSGTASNADQCYCPTGAPPTWTWGSAVTCGSSCASGGTAGKFVTVTASYNYTPLFPVYTYVQSGTITIGSIVQTQ